MLRSELVSRIAAESRDMSRAEVDQAVRVMVEAIVAQLAAGGRVELRKFGNFDRVEHAARPRRNPRTGAAVEVPAHTRIRFRASRKLLERLNAEGGE